MNTPSQHLSYRPHDPGHNYYAAGIYLITLVVGGRESLLSVLNSNVQQPDVILKDVGKAVMEEWHKTASIQASKGHKIKLHAAVCMPDHFHGVIEVEEKMDVSLGYIIQLFKASCTSRWRKLTCYVEPPSTAHAIRHMSHSQRQAYYATLPRTSRPLFDADYDDTICLNERHKQAMLYYVADNPRRAIMRRLYPQFTQRILCIRLTSTDKNGQTVTRTYSAFGNLFLLRWPRKIQVFCHRRLPGTTIPYETTPDYRSEHDAWIANIMQGATVIVTPGISKGELLMKNECIEKGYPLIHIQKEPIGMYWKPERSRFDACTNGRLLILAPWNPELLGEFNHTPSNTDYSIFHNLNDIAAEICLFEGEAKIVEGKKIF